MRVLIAFLTVLLVILLLGGCAGHTQYIDTYVQGPRLNAIDARPIQMRDIEWIIISKDNIEKYLPDIQSGKLTIVGMTPNDYEDMSINTMQILNFIQSQKNVIAAYKEFYETKTNP